MRSKNKKTKLKRFALFFIAQGVDAIFIAPVVQTGWGPVLEEAKDYNIPVFLLDRGIDVQDDSLYMTAVMADNVLEGELAGKWLIDTVGDKSCNVVELQGTVGASVAIDRKKGFQDAIASADNLEIIRTQCGEFTHSKVKKSWRASLKPKITVRIFVRYLLTTMIWQSALFNRLKKPG